MVKETTVADKGGEEEEADALWSDRKHYERSEGDRDGKMDEKDSGGVFISHGRHTNRKSS